MRNAAVDQLIDEVGITGAGPRRWYAAILFTYRCTIACRHCLFGCGPDMPDVVMEPERCVENLALLHETSRVVHIAGGEAMLYWNELVRTLELADRRGVAPHFIETNASFAVNDEIVSERLRFFQARGVRGMYISATPFHQENVPLERFLRTRRIAMEIFGYQNVMAPAPDPSAALADVAADEARLREHVRAHPTMMTGSGAAELARFLDPHPWREAPIWQGWNRPVEGRRDCLPAFQVETLVELHIDPYGNILTNCGLVLGRIEATTPARILSEGPEHSSRFVEMVCSGGPWALVAFARDEHGFRPPDEVHQACELCWLVRRFLRPLYPEAFGPEEVYSLPRQKRMEEE